MPESFFIFSLFFLKWRKRSLFKMQKNMQKHAHIMHRQHVRWQKLAIIFNY